MVTITDLFAGAGGSSTGAAEAGAEVVIAANHWDLACEVHQDNHPNTDHATADIHQADPRYFPRTDILWASPECTKWSVAQGKAAADLDPGLFEDPLSDEAATRSRMLMFDVPRFAEHHRYEMVIVENVVDVATRIEYRAAFERWLSEMHKLGYRSRPLYLNSMHAHQLGDPAPQSRDRIYVVFWREGNRAPDLDRWTRPYAVCPTHGRVQAIQAWKNPASQRGRYRAQYMWRCPNSACRYQVLEPAWLPAAAAIDWSIPGTRIGDRAKPLAAKTMARIEAGLRRYAREPFLYAAAGHTFERRPGVRTWPLTEPMRTLTTTNERALLVPAGGTWNDSAQPVDRPMRARTTRDTEGLVVMLRGQNTAKPTTDPLDTFAANGFHHALIMRNNTARGDDGQMSTPVTEPLRTLTTAGHQSLIQWGDLVVDFNGPARSTADPLPTQTTVDGDAIASREVAVEDCLFRMLDPSETARGMAFPADYRWRGNRRERQRLAGNAVCPPNARDLVAASIESLTR